MFMSLFQAAGADRSPFGDFWFEPVSGRSNTGMRVSADAALRLSAVWACVRILSETLACMPFCMYRYNDNGSKTFITDHPIYRLFNKAPNAWQTPFEWREMLQAHLVLRGNAYCQIVADRKGTIIALEPLHPDRIKIEMISGGEYRYRVLQPSGADLVLGRGEVWHLKGMSFDGILGLNPIELARDAVGMGLSAQEYGARFFQNNARPGGVIEFAGTFKDQTARKTFIESWQTGQSGLNQGKTAVLEHDMKYKEIGLNNTDAQFIEARKFQVTEIARMFRVPPHMIADLDRATFSNIEHQSLEFVLHTMTPHAERWESSIESSLLLDTEDDIEIEFDFTSLLRGDHAARAAYYNSGINTGWLTRNEARLMEGYDPKPGLDVPLQPLNMVPAGTQLPDPSKSDTAPKKVPAPDQARLATLAHAVAARVVRKETEMVLAARRSEDLAPALVKAYETLAKFMPHALSVSNQAAADYCASRIDSAAADGFSLADFEATAQQELERLALAGAAMDLPMAISHLASAITRQPAAQIKVEAPVSVSVPERTVEVQQPITLHASIEAPRNVTKTVITRRQDDGSIVSNVKED
jgi:HK97 family phage portal protein